jgi:hypothetical protein
MWFICFYVIAFIAGLSHSAQIHSLAGVGRSGDLKIVRIFGPLENIKPMMAIPEGVECSEQRKVNFGRCQGETFFGHKNAMTTLAGRYRPELWRWKVLLAQLVSIEYRKRSPVVHIQCWAFPGILNSETKRYEMASRGEIKSQNIKASYSDQGTRSYSHDLSLLPVQAYNLSSLFGAARTVFLNFLQGITCGLSGTLGSTGAPASYMSLPPVNSSDDGGANNQEAREANHPPIKRKLFIFVLFVAFLGFCLLTFYFVQSVENGNPSLNMKRWLGVFVFLVCAQFCFYLILRMLFR